MVRRGRDRVFPCAVVELHRTYSSVHIILYFTLLATRTQARSEAVQRRLQTLRLVVREGHHEETHLRDRSTDFLSKLLSWLLQL